mmetsp:Transcript_74644/g.207491  ORF Transcript_74644/g.207491 Transcript_74644/m.207491 type:complete len:227 (+) Transcript_74644:234-914(+)
MELSRWMSLWIGCLRSTTRHRESILKNRSSCCACTDLGSARVKISSSSLNLLAKSRRFTTSRATPKRVLCCMHRRKRRVRRSKRRMGRLTLTGQRRMVCSKYGTRPAHLCTTVRKSTLASIRSYISRPRSAQKKGAKRPAQPASARSIKAWSRSLNVSLARSTRSGAATPMMSWPTARPFAKRRGNCGCCPWPCRSAMGPRTTLPCGGDRCDCLRRETSTSRARRR